METNLVVPFCVWHPDSAPPHLIETLLFLPDHQTIATGSRSGQICLWEVCQNTNGSSVNIFPRLLLCGHKSAISALGHVPYDSLPYALVSCSVNGSLRVWDPRDGKCLNGSNHLLFMDPTTIPEVNSSDMYHLGLKSPYTSSSLDPQCVSISSLLSSSQNLVACLLDNGAVLIVNVTNMVVVSRLLDNEPVVIATAIAVPIPMSSAKETLLVTAGRTGCLKFWRITVKQGEYTSEREPILDHFATKHIRKRTHKFQSRKEPKKSSQVCCSKEESWFEDENDLDCIPVSLSLSPNNIFAVIGFPSFFTIYLCANMKPLLTVDLESSIPGETLTWSLEDDCITDTSFSSLNTLLVRLQSGNSISYRVYGIDELLSPGLELPFGINLATGHSNPVPSFVVDNFFGPSSSESIYAIPCFVYRKPFSGCEGKPSYTPPKRKISASTPQFLAAGDSSGSVYIWELGERNNKQDEKRMTAGTRSEQPKRRKEERRKEASTQAFSENPNSEIWIKDNEDSQIESSTKEPPILGETHSRGKGRHRSLHSLAFSSNVSAVCSPPSSRRAKANSRKASPHPKPVKPVLKCQQPSDSKSLLDVWKPPGHDPKRASSNGKITSTLLLEDIMTLILGYDTGKLSVHSLFEQSPVLILYDRSLSSDSSPLAHQGAVLCLWGLGTEVVKGLFSQDAPKSSKWCLQDISRSCSYKVASSSPSGDSPSENRSERKPGIVASSGSDGVVRIWELKGGCLIHRFAAHSSPVYELYYFPYSYYSCPDSEPEHSSIKTRFESNPMTIGDSPVRSLTESESNITSSEDEHSESEDPFVSPRLVESFSGSQAQTTAFDSPASPRSKTPQQSTRRRRSHDTRFPGPLSPRSRSQYSFAYSHESGGSGGPRCKRGKEGILVDALWILSLSWDRCVCLMSLRHLTVLARFGPHPRPIKSLGIRAAEGYLFVLCGEGSLYVWNIWTGCLERTATSHQAKELYSTSTLLVTVKRSSQDIGLSSRTAPVSSSYDLNSIDSPSLQFVSVNLKVILAQLQKKWQLAPAPAPAISSSASTAPLPVPVPVPVPVPTPSNSLPPPSSKQQRLASPQTEQKKQKMQNTPPEVPRRLSRLLLSPNKSRTKVAGNPQKVSSAPLHRRSRSAAGVRPVETQVPITKPELLQDQIFYQVLTTFIPWGIIPTKLEDAIKNKLSLSPPSLPFLPVVRGQRGSLSVILPRPDLFEKMNSSNTQVGGGDAASKSRGQSGGVYNLRSCGSSGGAGGGGGAQWKMESKEGSVLRYCVSPTLSAVHLLFSVVLCQQLAFRGLHGNTCNSLENFLAYLLRTRIDGYVEASLLLLADFWQNPSEIMQDTAKELFILCCKQVSQSDRNRYAKIWMKQLRSRLSQESKTKAALALGTVMLEFPNTLQISSKVPPISSLARNNPIFRSTPSLPQSSPQMTTASARSLDIERFQVDSDVQILCRELVNMSKNSSSSKTQTAALELLGKGYRKLWDRGLDDVSDLILHCFHMWQEKNHPCTSIAYVTLLHISRRSPSEVVRILTNKILSLDFTPAECSSCLAFLRVLMDQTAFKLVPEIPIMTQAVVLCLDPSNPRLKELCHQNGTMALNELVRRYPMTSFHQRSQLVALGEIDGTISVYDLKQAQRVHHLDPFEDSAEEPRYHPIKQPNGRTKYGKSGAVPPGVTALAFDGQGQMIASYSFQSGEIHFWELYSLSFFGFSLRPQLKCTLSVSRVKWPTLEQVALFWKSSHEVELIRGQDTDPLIFRI